MKIPGKTALVLGAAKGIGKHIALALASAGAKVVLTHYDWPEESKQMQEQFSALGHEHLTVKVDLRNADEIADLFDRISNRFGGLDILINNIERGGMPVVHGPYTPEQWDLEMETTLKAKWFVFNRALPLLKASGDGTAINISSIAALVGRSGPAGLIFNDGYSAANRAVSSFTETWARQGAPEVRVNELMLGFFETRHAQGTRGWPLLSPAEQQAIIDHTLLGRTGKIADIIKAIFFLIEDTAFMTGSVIRLDGGYILGAERVPSMPTGVL
ncbi:MAG: SDR family oxidoreductase [Proteobacteria bacterium]|nr:SDR family oxidoreductase [Pseudomonadota bacterium]MBU4296741.1 SDR family oxidoreductase [Pseudomonadota bacterium]MCG2745945.1 SDR family oxidoreductase [Desulfobulbaceae bacterium]